MTWPGKWLATVPRGVVFDQPSPETPAKPRPRPVAVTPPPPSGKADGRRNVSRTPPNKSARPRPAPLSPVQRGGPPEGSVSLVRHIKKTGGQKWDLQFQCESCDRIQSA